MTLGELAKRENLVGRVFRAHETNGFAYRGIVTKTEVRGETVILSLENHDRRFEGKTGHSNWKHLPDTEIGFGTEIQIQPVEKIFSFSVPGAKSRIYLYPKGTRLEEAEHAPRI